jgi:hypothetical protein
MSLRSKFNKYSIARVIKGNVIAKSKKPIRIFTGKIIKNMFISGVDLARNPDTTTTRPRIIIMGAAILIAATNSPLNRCIILLIEKPVSINPVTGTVL